MSKRSEELLKAVESLDPEDVSYTVVVTLLAETLAEVAEELARVRARVTELETTLPRRSRDFKVVQNDGLCVHGNWPDECPNMDCQRNA